jgi:MoaA/NifB/PqqE/SkfB family radical SAM enzyme
MKIPFVDKTPFCTAPFTAFLVDPDKGVRPCCDFEGHLGNIREQPLSEILSSPGWQKVRTQISRDDMPDGCVSCYKREKATGWSVRRDFIAKRATKNGQWKKGLTEIEINSSNVCNLTCTHCSADFSTGWLSLIPKLQEAKVPHYRGQQPQQILKPDPENIVRQLSGLDLSHMDLVRFKGGEPMLNPDVPAVLRYFKERGLLGQMEASFVSNGSVVSEEVLELLRAAKTVSMCISVDGTGEVQDYIRRGPSGISRIERFIEAFASLPTITFNLSISVMVYNVFSLDRISAWWNGLDKQYPGKMKQPLRFPLCVIQPPILSIRVLQDGTRKKLIDKYRRLHDANYSHVLKALKQPFAGEKIHNDFVAYTQGMDKIWKSDVLRVVPELAPEMVLLEVPVRSERRRWGFGPARDADPRVDTLRKGLSLSQSGKYDKTLRLYEQYFKVDDGRLAGSWQIRLHRAIVFAKMERWEASLAELYELVRRQPQATLSAMKREEETPRGEFFEAIPVSVREGTGFSHTASFRLLLEGLAYRALENEAESTVRLDKAVALDPGSMLAREARAGVGGAGPGGRYALPASVQGV